MARKIHDDDVEELAVAMRVLVRRIRSAAPSETNELPWTQRAIMIRLDAEGPTTTAELARAEGVKPQSMGAAIAVLEEMGLVERKPHPTDGRQMIIALTEKGVRVRKDARSAKRTWLAQTLAKLDEKEQESLPVVISLLKRLGEL